MNDRTFVKLSLYDDGYIWVRFDQIRLIRSDYNSLDKMARQYAYVQLRDGLEYKVSHNLDSLVDILGLKQ